MCSQDIEPKTAVSQNLTFRSIINDIKTHENTVSEGENTYILEIQYTAIWMLECTTSCINNLQFGKILLIQHIYFI